MVEILERPRGATLATPATAAPLATPATAEGVRLYVATPCYGCQMNKSYLASLLGLQAECLRRGIQCAADLVGNESLICRARNILAARFLRSDATHLLFIDADVAFNPASVFRLLDADKDVVTAVYPKKTISWDAVERHLQDPSSENAAEPVSQVGLDFNVNIIGRHATAENGFVRVLDSATGFMLIKRSAMQKMADAYREELHAVNDISGNSVTEYVALFATMIDPDTRRYLSEDFSFCRRWQAVGGEIWADLATPLVHVGTHQWEGDIRLRMTAG